MAYQRKQRMIEASRRCRLSNGHKQQYFNFYHLSPHIRAHALCAPRARYVFLNVVVFILSVNEQHHSSRESTLYSLYTMTHDVDGKFLARATDEDVNDLLKDMPMIAAHKVELMNTISK